MMKAVCVVCVLAMAAAVFASSHSEAPGITKSTHSFSLSFSLSLSLSILPFLFPLLSSLSLLLAL